MFSLCPSILLKLSLVRILMTITYLCFIRSLLGWQKSYFVLSIETYSSTSNSV